jgi:hypothetical protein
VPRAIEHECRIELRSGCADFDNVESLVAQVQHRSATQAARFGGIEHLDSNALIGAFGWRHLSVQRGSPRRKRRSSDHHGGGRAGDSQCKLLWNHRIRFHS